MDALTRIQAKINGFPAYGSLEAVGQSDQLVRAYVGERLAELQSRVPEAVADALEPLIERCAFANQRDIAPLELPKVHVASADPVLAADEQLLDAADQAASVDAAGVTDYAARINALFDARDESLVTAGIALRRG